MMQGALEIVAASVCAGWAQHFLLHPLDTMKTRLQYSKAPVTRSVRESLWEAMQDMELPGSSSEAKEAVLREKSRRVGFWNKPVLSDIAGAAKILRKNRFISLYSGLLPAMIAVVPTAIVYMPSYELASSTLQNLDTSKEIIAPLAGLATGIVCATVRVPASVLKSRVQLGLSSSSLHALKQAYKAGGLAELYAGFFATLALDIATAIVQFTTIDLGQRTSPWLASSPAALGFLASALATTASEPIDVIRTRIMSRVKGQKDARFSYNGLIDGFSQALRTEGLTSLYRGLLPRLLLKSFGGAIWYSTYVHSKDFLLSLALFDDHPHEL